MARDPERREVRPSPALFEPDMRYWDDFGED
jgi:hypothetical protein